MSSSKAKNVQLGFANEQEGWLLKNRFFPSKIGGYPAWLELKNIPETRDLLCEYCEEPCIFLCQVYAGSENTSHAFHRTVFVFICRNGKCCTLNNSGNIKVIRSQLHLDNCFYPSIPADDSIESDGIEPPVKICRVCGCRGSLVCGKCMKANYCRQLHQKIDWNIHKKWCSGETSNDNQISLSEIPYPEFEIVIEQENHQEIHKQESEKEAEKRRLHEYEQLMKAGGTGTISEISDTDLNEFAESKEDKMFGKFKKAIEGYEPQVLRYSRGSSPLWISDYGILQSTNVPNCGNCGARRTFEFQLMPQMLNELKNYDLDWGIIAIYTCEKDCDVKGKYIAEFAYKQDITKGEDANIGKLNLDSVTISNKPTFNLSEHIDKLSQHRHESKTLPSKPKTKAFEDCDSWE